MSEVEKAATLPEAGGTTAAPPLDSITGANATAAKKKKKKKKKKPNNGQNGGAATTGVEPKAVTDGAAATPSASIAAADNNNSNINSAAANEEPSGVAAATKKKRRRRPKKKGAGANGAANEGEKSGNDEVAEQNVEGESSPGIENKAEKPPQTEEKKSEGEGAAAPKKSRRQRQREKKQGGGATAVNEENGGKGQANAVDEGDDAEQKNQITESATDEHSVDDGGISVDGSTDGVGTPSKSQRRKMRRKRAKQKKQGSEEVETNAAVPVDSKQVDGTAKDNSVSASQEQDKPTRPAPATTLTKKDVVTPVGDHQTKSIIEERKEEVADKGKIPPPIDEKQNEEVPPPSVAESQKEVPLPVVEEKIDTVPPPKKEDPAPAVEKEKATSSPVSDGVEKVNPVVESKAQLNPPSTDKKGEKETPVAAPTSIRTATKPVVEAKPTVVPISTNTTSQNINSDTDKKNVPDKPTIPSKDLAVYKDDNDGSTDLCGACSIM